MLGVEILFRFPSREIKDQILNNYERGGVQPVEDGQMKKKKVREEENAINLDNFDHQNDLTIENLLPNDQEVEQDQKEEASFKWT